jgi:hypothetical protein
MRWIIIAIAFLSTGCPAVCEHLQTRCAADVAQVCDSEGHWQNVMDCSNVEPDEWRCAPDLDGEHTCRPTDGPARPGVD